MDKYLRERAIAVHEAGHAVAAYLLNRRFVTISVVADENSLGRVVCHAAPKWVQPDAELTGRTRLYLDDQIMTTLAGAETERAWLLRNGVPRSTTMRHVRIGGAHDRELVVDMACYVCGSAAETEAYVEWLRQRVLTWTEQVDPPAMQRPSAISDAFGGRTPFWHLVESLADAVTSAGTLSGKAAREVIKGSLPRLPGWSAPDPNTAPGVTPQ